MVFFVLALKACQQLLSGLIYASYLLPHIYIDSTIMGDTVREPQLSQADGPPCPIQRPIWQRLNDSALTFSNRLAVASLHQAPQLYDIDNNPASKKYLRWTYADLKVGVDRLAANLEALGAKRGLAVATFLYNGVEYVLAAWAAHKLGCPFVPINPRALTNAEDAVHMLRVASISIVIVQDNQLATKIDAMSIGLKSVQTRIVVSEPPDPSWLTFASLVSKQKPIYTGNSNVHMTEFRKDDIISILFTSGTTSLPKGVPHTDATLNAFCENLSLGGRSETSIFCSVLPNNHAMGYFYALHFMMHGAAVVYPSSTFDATAMVRGLEDEKATHTALVPTTLHALLEALKTRGTPLSSSLVDVCLSGSSITPDDIRQATFELRSQGVSTGFGMTEGSPIWTEPKSNPEDLINGNLTIAGRASLGARIRICDTDSRLPVPRGTRGEVHQSGPGLVKDYLGPGPGPGMNQFYTGEDGRLWFATGDQGIMLPDGRVSITGRYKDMIIRGGENIAPAAIESVVYKFCCIQVCFARIPFSLTRDGVEEASAALQRLDHRY